MNNKDETSGIKDYNLTLTRVVFELAPFSVTYCFYAHLTLTRVVFEFFLKALDDGKRPYLTLTRVVFEYSDTPATAISSLAFNFNKSCI